MNSHPAKRLLFITRKFPPSVGGMEVYSYELDKAIRDLGCSIQLLAPDPPILGRPSPLKLARFFCRACLHLLRNRDAYDRILIGDFVIASLAIVARVVCGKSVRIGVSLHGEDVFLLRRRSFVASFYRAVARLVLTSNSIDIAIANSTAIQSEALQRGFLRVTQVPLATKLPDVTDIPRADPPRLLFAGRLIRYKGLSWFVEHVWPHLDRRLELHVAGEVWDEPEHACLVGDPRIHYLGKVDYDELPALRASAIACVMPNRPPEPGGQDEGFGLSALESAACGTPIVAARTGGLPNAVIEGTTGFLLTPLDAQAWIRCLQDITGWTSDQRKRFAESARAEIARSFNWPLVAERTLAALAHQASAPTDDDGRRQ